MSKADIPFTDGGAYERVMGRWSRRVGEAFLNWLDVPKGLQWLDVGCGNGAFTEKLIGRCAPIAVMGLDPSGDQLAYARSRPQAQMAEFRVGDAQALPFGDDKFDVAVMALVIAFIPDPAKAIAEMVRVVRPGGLIASYMWDYPGGGSPNNPIFTAARSMGVDPPVPPSAAFSRRDAMRLLWEGAGLAAITTRVIRIPIVYADFDDFWTSNALPVGTQGKLIYGLSPSAREQLRTRLREQLPTSADGRITFEASANAISGRVPG